MARKAKTPKVPGFLRTIVAGNLSALIARHYRALPNITQQQKKLAEDSGVEFSTIQRVMKMQTGANLETLEALAVAFDLLSYQLLVPSLNVQNPQLIKGADKDEQRLYASFRKSQAAPAKRKTLFLEETTPAEPQRQRVR